MKEQGGVEERSWYILYDIWEETYRDFRFQSGSTQMGKETAYRKILASD